MNHTSHKSRLRTVEKEEFGSSVPVPNDAHQTLADAGSPTILIVDDDRGLTTLIQKHLHREGFTTVEAGTATEAAAWLGDNQANLMLLDLKLPDMVADELIRLLTEQGRCPPFIIITAQGDERIAVEMMKRGARDYLVKDITLLDLLPAIVSRALTELEREKKLAQAEEALRKSEALVREQLAELDHLYNTTPVGLCLLDTDLRYLRINERLAAMNGRSVLEHIGRTVREVVPELTKQLEPSFYRVIESGEPILNLEVSGVAPAEPEEQCYWLVSYYPLKLESGVVQGVGVVVQDITERKQAEEEARHRQAELAHVSRLSMLGEVASGIAHELNQPLTAIANHAQASARRIRSGGWPSAKLVETMEKILDQAERGAEVIRRIRAFIRKENVERSFVAINNLIYRAVELMEFEATKQTIALDFDLAEELPEVFVDAVQIEQVLVNLVRNGFEAMENTDHEERKLAICTSMAEDRTVEVAVSDTGSGFAPEIIDRAFEPFLTTKPEGMGLGLAISRSIIEAHGGRLQVSANGSRGSVLRFTLPTSDGDRDDAV